ncbi:TPA: hypothetical protein N0F65_005273 [Lagenidium giganteum]|uniref:Uncharacterized protein n=1 Tax=Lagenidium giganteum TaxID=4803 RepID=A0AAV2Z0N0_9STRA|nr:TPA: hypothetical protein N0F65_005273 [Lagenidium giganteum]
MPFFNVKSYNYARVAFSSAYFSRTQLLWWKLACAILVLVLSVIVPSVLLPWSGYNAQGKENIPVLLYLSPSSAILSVVSSLVGVVNLLRPPFDSTRMLVYRKHLGFFSWEVLGWILHECATTNSLVVFMGFWVVIYPKTTSSMEFARILGSVSQCVLIIADFFITGTQFKSNHVILTMIWPTGWLIMQICWVLAGHQPCYDLLDFRTPVSPIAAVLFLVATAGAFFFLKRYAAYVHRPRPAKRRGAVHGGEAVVNVHNDTPMDSARAAKYELMEDPSNRYFNYSELDEDSDAPVASVVSSSACTTTPRKSVLHIGTFDEEDQYDLDDPETDSPARKSSSSVLRSVSFQLGTRVK